MFGMHLKSWLVFLGWFRSKASRKPAAKKHCHLKVDVLEDRTVPAALTGVISGHALIDVTGNGLSADDTAQQGVVVRLYRDGHNNGKLGGCDVLVATKVTGADGGYSFANLAAGKYFVTETTPKGFIQTGPATSDYYTINLAQGQAAAGFDFDNFQKVRETRITDVVFTVVHGTTTRTFRSLDNHTHEGDTVTVSFTVPANAPPVTLSLVSYDAVSGNFNEHKLSQDQLADSQTGTFGPGRYSLTVHIPNNYYQIYFVRGAVIDHFGAARSNISYWDQDRLISADAGGHGRFVPASLSGTVLDDANRDGAKNAGDTALAGVTVTLTGTNELGRAVSLTTVTDSNGVYHFTGLRAGTYSIVQTVPAGLTAFADFAGSLGGITTSPTQIDHIVVHNANAGVNYDFLNQQPVARDVGTISGTVTQQPSEGASYMAAVNFTVQLRDAEGNVVATTATDGNGQYSFANVAAAPGNTYTVFFVNPDTTQYFGATAQQVDLFDPGQVVTGVDGSFRHKPQF